MIDRGNVIYNIERCISHVPDACRDCSKYGTWDAMVCMEELLSDALELLKEQEPKLVDNIQIRTLDTVGDCPSCGIGVSKRYHPMHCGLCGQAVKWDATD